MNTQILLQDTRKSGNRNFRTNQLNADAVDKTEAKIPHCIIFDNTGVMLQAIEHYVANKRYRKYLRIFKLLSLRENM